MSKVEQYITSIPDFPKEGIIFRDITTVLGDADGFHLAVDEMTALLDGVEFDAIAGLESRGFLFGAPMAYNLHKAFIPIRKQGKLPRATSRMSYELEYGMETIEAGAVILAMGCRERPRGALNIPGYRPAGIYSAGTAQRLMNIEGYSVGKEVVILGSGDIGLIMARRMTLEGAKVKVVAELMPYSGGLKRNIVQCLDDYGIPLKLSHTVVDIQGKERVTGITLAEVGPDRKPIPGTEEHYSCDTLLLSVGLIPENELTKEAGVEMNRVTSGPNVNDQLETSVEGVFACGNVLHVHDLVDYVSEEATLAGTNAAAYVRSQNGETEAKAESHTVTLKAENGVRYTVPQTIDVNNMRDQVVVRFRVADVYRDRSISVYLDGVRVQARKKKVLAPGEMEQVQKYPDLKEIVICTEVE